MMDKLDLTKADKTYYDTGKTPQLIELGAIDYLTFRKEKNREVRLSARR